MTGFFPEPFPLPLLHAYNKRNIAMALPFISYIDSCYQQKQSSSVIPITLAMLNINN